MTEKEKISKTKKKIKINIFFGIFYFFVTLIVLINLIYFETEDPLNYTDSIAIFLYIILLFSLLTVTINTNKINNPNQIRNKAIREYDERHRKIQQAANSNTLSVMILILMLGLIISLSINSIELFGFCVSSIILIIIINIIIKAILKKRH